MDRQEYESNLRRSATLTAVERSEAALTDAFHALLEASSAVEDKKITASFDRIINSIRNHHTSLQTIHDQIKDSEWPM